MQLKDLRTGQIVQCVNQFYIVIGVFDFDLQDNIITNSNDNYLGVCLYNMNFSSKLDKDFLMTVEAKAFLRKLREYILNNTVDINCLESQGIEDIELYDKMALRDEVEHWIVKNKLLNSRLPSYLKGVLFVEETIATMRDMRKKLEKYYVKVDKLLSQPMKTVTKTVDGGVYYSATIKNYVIRLSEKYFILINGNRVVKEDLVLRPFSDYNFNKLRNYKYTVLNECLDGLHLQFTGVNIMDFEYNKKCVMPLLKKINAYYGVI